MTNRTFARAALDLALVATGWCAVGLGTAGMFVPGLPTTVFVLIAFYCFSKSSPRVARWLTEDSRLGAVLGRFIADGGLSRTSKGAALTAMWTSILVSAAVVLRLHVAVACSLVVLGIAGTFAILVGVRTIPDRASAASAL